MSRPAIAQAPPPAEANVRTALERIARIDPQLALGYRRRSDRDRPGATGGRRQIARAACRAAGADQGQYRKRRPTADDRRQPGARRTTSPTATRRWSRGCAPAGAVILGKTNLSEWANIRSTHSISGWSAVGGQTRNPWALDRNACGSSSGSGAAVAAGLVRMAIGTETDGSVTCPASINGIVGLKPTVGLVSRTHIVPISHSQDTAGPMAASVREAAELLTVIAGSDPADAATRDADRHKRDYAAGLDADSLKGKRIGVHALRIGPALDPAFDTALAILREQGRDAGRHQEVRRQADRQERRHRPAMPSSRPTWPNI